MITVARRWFRLNLGLWLLWLLGVTGVAALYVPLYRRYEAEGLFTEGPLPDGVSNILGLENLGTPTGFLGATVLGPLGLCLLLGAAITFGAGAIAGAEERGLLDRSVARGVSRFWVYTGRLVACTLAVTLLGVALTVLVGVGVRVIELPIGMAAIAAAGASLTLLAVLYGVVTYAIGAATGRSGLAKVAASLLAIVGFVTWSLHTRGMSVSPFTWALARAPLEHGVSAGGIAALVLATAIAAALGLLSFLARDVGRWRVDATHRP